MSKKQETEELDELETGLLEDQDTTDDDADLDLESDPENGVPVDEPDKPEDKKLEPKSEQKAKPDYDKQQQMLDQERANARKAREQAERLEQSQTQITQQWETSQKELAELKAAMAAKKEERQKLDPNSVTSEQLVAEIEALHGKISDRDKKIGQLEADMVKAEQARQVSAQQDAQLALQEQVLSEAEEDLAATLGGSWEQYRVDAVKEADRRVDSGEVDRPKTIRQGKVLMLACYKDIADQSTKAASAKKPVRSDSGRGGISPQVKEIKSGSLNSVKDQLSKKPHLWRNRAT